METAKVFENGRSQAVRLPKKYRFDTDEVVVQRLGSSLILTPKDKIWETFMAGIEGFTDDFFEAMESRHDVEIQSERESL